MPGSHYEPPSTSEECPDMSVNHPNLTLSSPGEQSPVRPKVEPLPTSCPTMGPFSPPTPMGPSFPQSFEPVPSVWQPGPTSVPMENYSNYLQTFFKPMEAFLNPFASHLPERPVSPIAEDDYTIQDLSSKISSPSPPPPPSTPSTSNDSTPLDTSWTQRYSMKHGNTGYVTPDDMVTPPLTNMGHICDICKEGFRTAKGLNCHRSAVHADGSTSLFSCRVCSKNFSISSHLTRHEERHSQKINMACFLCTSHFKTTNNLKLHLFSVHILSIDHSAVFNVSMDADLEPVLFQNTFIPTDMEGSLDEDDVTLHIRGSLPSLIKLYQSHFSTGVDSTPFVQVVFHNTCCKIMTVSRITTSQFSLTLVPQSQVITESKLVKRERKVIGFEVAVIAKLCLFMINQKLVALFKDGTTSVTISTWDIKIVA